MYLGQVMIDDVKCFGSIELDFSPHGKPRLWTNLLGPNGSGKSTLLQAISIALAGEGTIREITPDLRDWIRSDKSEGAISCALIPSWEDEIQGKRKRPRSLLARYQILKDPDSIMTQIGASEHASTVPKRWPVLGNKKTGISKDMEILETNAYNPNRQGWFACGYGPFRRLSGGDASSESDLYRRQRIGRFVTIFREDVAITQIEEYLNGLSLSAEYGTPANQRIYSQIKKLFAEDLLPEPAELKVTNGKAMLSVKDRGFVGLQDLSDGYRSMIALIIDLFRWLSIAFPKSADLRLSEGVVLIDELDAHAHPAWQRQIGPWLRRTFPNLQFIVATHSPFLAQVADEPGGNIVLEHTTEGVRARDDIESVETWRADQILTEIFGLPTTRSPEVERKKNRFQELNLKRESLSDDEREEYKTLKLWLRDLSPAIEDPNERRKAEIIQQAVDHISSKKRS